MLIVWLAGSIAQVLGQARMTQDGSVVRLNNASIAATFNLSSCEWEIVKPDGQVLFSGLPAVKKKETTETFEIEDVSQTAPAQPNVKNPADELLKPGRSPARNSKPMRIGPKPPPQPTVTKIVTARTQTFVFSRTQTCKGPGLRIEAELDAQTKLRIAVPDEGPWVFMEPLFSTSSSLAFEGMLHASGEWSRNKLAIHSNTNQAILKGLEASETTFSSSSAVCLYREDTGGVIVFGAWSEGMPKWIDLETNRETGSIRFKLRSDTIPDRGSNWWFFGACPSTSAAVRTLEPAFKTRTDEGITVMSLLKALP